MEALTNVNRGYVQKVFLNKKKNDYNETYAPVAKLTTFRIFMAIECHQILFLNGNLEEAIFMTLPEDFEIENKVFKLKKVIYGLKQYLRM